MHEFVHESDLQCFFCADILACENHVERDLQSDNTRQALRTTRARNESELHFGKREDGFGVFGRDAMPARECDFESAPECGPMNRGDDRLGQRGKFVEEALAGFRQCFALRRRRNLCEFVDVGTGNPRIGLATQKHSGGNRRVAFDGAENAIEDWPNARVQCVDGRPWLVVDNDGHTVFDMHRDADLGVVHDTWLAACLA